MKKHLIWVVTAAVVLGTAGTAVGVDQYHKHQQQQQLQQLRDALAGLDLGAGL